ncbi:MAG: hypothetical protein FWG84_02935 [Bacteroidales bacterium]|nr:hypothetical protein [Bacteroidales bacterium]
MIRTISRQSERTFYLSNTVVYFPYQDFTLSNQRGTDEINTLIFLCNGYFLPVMALEIICSPSSKRSIKC